MLGRRLPLAALLLAAACGDFVDNIPARPAASDDPAIAETAYPSLSTVPARPQLTYSLEQRREIARGLVADRANARYAGDTVRQDLGRPVQPDTAPPLPPLPATDGAAARADPGGDLTLAYIEEALARDSDDGSLGDFLERLERRPPASAEARPSPPPPADPPAAIVNEAPAAAAEPALELERESQPAAEAELASATSSEPETASVGSPAVEPMPAATEPVPAVGLSEPAASLPSPPGDTPADAVGARESMVEAAAETEPAAVATAQLENAEDDVGERTVAAVPAARAEAAPTSLPLAILFDPDAVELAEQARTQLQRLTPQLAGDAFIVVSGGGERAGLAMERARRVAAMLVNSGIPAARIAIEMGGESDVVVVYEAGVRG